MRNAECYLIKKSRKRNYHVHSLHLVAFLVKRYNENENTKPITQKTKQNTKHNMEKLNLTTKQWTIIFVVVALICVVLFALWLYGGSTKSLSPQEIIERMRNDDASSNLSPQQRQDIIRSMTARSSSSSLPQVERERILESMTARPVQTKN